MAFKHVIADIRSLRIQGAENVAKSAVRSLIHLVHESKAKTSKQLLSQLHKAREELIKTRLTEPCMRNTLNYVFSNLPKDRSSEIVKTLVNQIEGVLNHFVEAKKKIVEIGEKKIKNGMVVFTHCHSSTVTGILIAAKKKGKRFEVHCTETRPVFQGRKTAAELAKAGIPVTLYVDSAARLALKHADVAFIGADAITTEGKVINKIGSELIAEAAKRLDVPLYACTNSWKFDPKTVFGFEEKIEKRYSSEVWEKPPKGVKISNYAFEVVKPELVSGIISELGIYNPLIFVEELKNSYPWMFKV